MVETSTVLEVASGDPVGMLIAMLGSLPAYKAA